MSLSEGVEGRAILHVYCDEALYEGNIEGLAQVKFQSDKNYRIFNLLQNLKRDQEKKQCEVVLPAHMNSLLKFCVDSITESSSAIRHHKFHRSINLCFQPLEKVSNSCFVFSISENNSNREILVRIISCTGRFSRRLMIV